MTTNGREIGPHARRQWRDGLVSEFPAASKRPPANKEVGILYWKRWLTGFRKIITLLRPLVVALALALTGCGEWIGGYMAVSSISANGFVSNGKESSPAFAQHVRIWGYVDHHNLYGDGCMQEILGDWWSGEGPDPTTWRFNLKARKADETGHSFPVIVPNDPERDAVLRAFVEDAIAQKPTRVFLKGRIVTFDAPTNFARRVGMYMELESSRDILLELRQAD